MSVEIRVGDCLELLRAMPEKSVNCCVTSPPYWGLRDYGQPGQFGLEPTPAAYAAKMVEVFAEVSRVLRDDGTLWLNLGDSYSSGGRTTQVAPTLRSTTKDAASGKHANLNGLCVRPGVVEGLAGKQLIGVPWRVAFALQDAGWFLRSDIIWAKPNPMPESVQDRPTRSHEYIFLFSKRPKYYYDTNAIKEPASEVLKAPDLNGSTIGGGAYGRHVLGDAIPEKERRTDKQRGHSRRHDGFNDRWDHMPKTEQCGSMRNKRDVWFVGTAPYKGAHFATFPPKLIEPCILAGCPEGGTVLDPFGGSGTTGMVSRWHGRNAILLELNPEYAKLAEARCVLDPKPKKKYRVPKPAIIPPDQTMFL